MMPLKACNFQVAQDSQQKVGLEPEEGIMTGQCPPPHNSDESLRIVAKDSLEELHASSRYVKENSPPPMINDVNVVWNDKNSHAPPTKLHKKSLTLKIDGADFELEQRKRGPLSPFTNAGALRRMISPHIFFRTTSGHRVWNYRCRRRKGSTDEGEGAQEARQATGC